MRVPKTLTMTRKNKQTKLKPKTREERERNKKTRKRRKTTRRRGNERKMYLKLVTSWIPYMYNVTSNIKARSTGIWIFLKLNIFFITKRPSLNTKPVNLLIQSAALIDVKKYLVSKNMWICVDWSHKLVPEGLGNCSFDLLSELCSDISSTKRHLSLTFKKSTRNNC